MTAILRYAILKTWREQLLQALLLAPAVIFLAPLLGLAGRSVLRGESVLPVAIDPKLGAPGTAALFWEVSLPFAAIVAGIAAFRALRSEVASRSVGFFYLASAPRTVTVAVTIYGTIAGTVAYVLAVLVVSLMTGTADPQLGLHVLIALVSTAATSALATVLLAVSAEYSMLVPVCVAGLAASFAVKSGYVKFIGVALLATVILMTIAQYVWGRRCAV